MRAIYVGTSSTINNLLIASSAQSNTTITVAVVNSTNTLTVASSAQGNTTSTGVISINVVVVTLVTALSAQSNAASTIAIVSTTNNLVGAASAQTAFSSIGSTSIQSKVYPNMRLIYNNLSSIATLTADTTAGSLVVTNMQSDIKSDVWRATITSGVITSTFTSIQTLSAVCLAFTNMTPTATIRVQLYSDATATVQILDTGTKLACPAASVVVQGFSAANNIYGYGGGSYATSWFTQTAGVRAIKITLVDTNNTLGYIEASRLIMGTYFSPVYNPDFGVTLSHMDLSKSFRTDSGDLITDIGTRYRRISLNLSVLTVADRTAFTSIVRSNGLSTPMMLSLYPENSDNELERDHQIYGKLSAVSAMASPYYNTYSMPFDLEEI